MAMVQFNGNSRTVLQGVWTFSFDGNAILPLSPRRKPNLVQSYIIKTPHHGALFICIFFSSPHQVTARDTCIPQERCRRFCDTAREADAKASLYTGMPFKLTKSFWCHESFLRKNLNVIFSNEINILLLNGDPVLPPTPRNTFVPSAYLSG